MDLKEIYRPIKKEIDSVEKLLRQSLRKTENESILEFNRFLLEAPGKRIRPTLAILSAKASLGAATQSPSSDRQLIKIATAIELVHMASLIHDDVIDHSRLRHNRPTVNRKWGQDVAITLGDYLYSVAFNLFSTCGNTDILQCISSATKTMCEGELLQVSERGNIDLLKDRYILIIKKKTAMFFAASCQAGVLASNGRKAFQVALREYGMNFGIAFQIVDDYLDIIGEEKKMGKTPGQDIGVGEMTLPILNLLESVSGGEKKKLKRLLTLKNNKDALRRIKSRIFNRDIKGETIQTASFYIDIAKEKINKLSSSPYKEGLLNLADFIMSNEAVSYERKH